VTITLDSPADFSLETLRRVAWEGKPVALGPAARARIQKARRAFLALIAAEPDRPVYGVTSGFGDRASVMLSEEERQAQATRPPLVRSMGFGPALPERTVRAMIFTRLVNYVSGYAAVSLETTEAVVAMLDGRPLPVVRLYAQDSEGELHQLFNLFHPLMGEPSQLRDQNALRNGTGCAPGLVADTALLARRRAHLALRVLALSLDAANMGLGPLDPALKPLLRDPHENAAIDALQADLTGVETLGRRQHQAPISWRIVTRMAGQMLRVVAEAQAAARHLLEAVNDNPVFLGPEEAPPHGRCVTTGGFHVPRAYHALNWLAQGWADVAAILAKQVDQMHRGAVTGLADKLFTAENRFSTFFLATAAYEVATRAQEAARPALTPLYPGHDTQTDTIMPLFRAWEREAEAARCFEALLAMLAASASQALDVAGREPAPPLRSFLVAVRERFPVVRSPRDLGVDTERLTAAFASSLLDCRTSAFLGEG
jgi:histidine ammonia-lyase